MLAGNVSGNKTAGSTLTSGAGNDAIYAGNKDVVNAGEGDNNIYLQSNREVDTIVGGATVQIADNSVNTISGFMGGFDKGADILRVSLENANIAYNGANLTLTDSTTGTKTTVEGSGVNSLLVGDTYDDASKVYVAQSNGTVSSFDNVANVYYGDNSAMNFASYDSDVFINLNQEMNENFIGSSDNAPTLKGTFNKVAGGKGKTTLYGSSANETLVAGDGNNTLWGSGGNDAMVGNTGTSKTGNTTFGFLAGDGRDTISNFDFGNDVVYTDNDIQDVSVSGSNVVIGLSGDDKLTIVDGAKKNFDINVHGTSFKASVTSGDVTYSDSVNYYNTSKGSASITASGSSRITMWLNGDADLSAAYGGGKQYIGDYKYISAKSATAAVVLAGNENTDNVITAGKSGSVLWGGGISNDTLIGGDGVDKFYYMRNNGNDVIQKATANDVVVLDGMEMSDITSTDVSSSAVTLNFSDGGSLTLNTNSGTTFKVGGENGAAYVTDGSGNWTRK